MTAAELAEKVNKQFNRTVLTQAVAKELLEIRGIVWKSDVPYFEAKPMRNMPLSEAKLVIVPEGTSQELLNALNDNNIPVETYEAGNEQARLDLLNGATAQKYMFAIDEGMSDIERYNELKDARLSVKDYSGGRQLTEAEVNALETKVQRNARKSVKKLVEKFGVVKHYSNSNANIEFNFSGNSAAESIHKQGLRTGDYLAMGKMFAAFDSIVENAIPIEIHGDKYKGTVREDPGLGRVYVLASAYYDNGIVPVQLEVKEFSVDRESQLYVAVTAKKIEADVKAPGLRQDAAPGTVTSFDVSISDILSNINPSDGDFLKYVPDQFLNDAQKASKQEALEKEKARIDKFGTYALDKDFLRETMNAIDTEALEGKLFSLSTVKNLKGLGVWLKEPSRIFDAIAGDDRELRNALHEIFEKPHSDATGRYASNIQKMQARVEQIALDAGALTVNKKGKKTYHEEVSAAIQNYGEGYHMKDCVVNAWVAAQDAVHVVAKADGNTLIDKELTLKELRRNFGYANGNYIWDKAFSDADSDALNIDTAPYTLEDLKRDFPDSWEKIVKADEQFREMYEEYINDMNAMLEKIYPYAFSERDDTLEKLTAQAEKKENRIKETEEAINERLKRLGAIEAEMASKKKTDTKVYDTLRTRKDKINEAIADLKELKARYQEDLAVIAAKKNYLLDMSKSGESLNRMHKLQYRQDYYHHFQELGQETNLRKLLFGNKQSDISPAIVGRREQSKAKGRWAGFFQQRQGDARTADAVNGMLKYGTLAEYKLAFQRFGAEVVSGVPFSNIATFLLGQDNIENWLGETDMTRYGSDTLAGGAVFSAASDIASLINWAWTGEQPKWETLISDLATILPPMGGKQLARTAIGATTALRGYSSTYVGGEEKVQFATDGDVGEAIHAMLFGKWALPEAAEYTGEDRFVQQFAKRVLGIKGLSASTGSFVDKNEFESARTIGLTGKEYFQLKTDLKEYSTQDGKRSWLYGMNLTAQQKAQLDALLVTSGDDKKVSNTIVYTRSQKEDGTWGDWQVKADYGSDDLFKLSQYGSTRYMQAAEAMKQGTSLANILNLYDAMDGEEMTTMDDKRSWIRENITDTKQAALLDGYIVSKSSSNEVKVEGTIVSTRTQNEAGEWNDWEVKADYTNDTWYALSQRSSEAYEKALSISKANGDAEKVLEYYEYLDSQDKVSAEEKRDWIYSCGGTAEERATMDAILTRSGDEVTTKGAIVYSKGKVVADYSSEIWYEISKTSYYDKAQTAYQSKGISPETSKKFFEEFSTLTAKGASGKTVNGLKKERTWKLLNRLNLTQAQKQFLYDLCKKNKSRHPS